MSLTSPTPNCPSLQLATFCISHLIHTSVSFPASQLFKWVGLLLPRLRRHSLLQVCIMFWAHSLTCGTSVLTLQAVAQPLTPNNLASDLKPASSSGSEKPEKVKVRVHGHPQQRSKLSSASNALAEVASAPDLTWARLSSHAASAKTRNRGATSACCSPDPTTRKKTVRAWSCSIRIVWRGMDSRYDWI